MTVLHDILLALLLAGGVFVEVQLARFLATLRRVKEAESDHLLSPASVDPTPSEIFEVLYGANHSGTD
ncbi:MAG: hypothetical protein CMQ38_12990 [Gammaproteobacteria bacterium]|nr:hypothetical protein [Gammaproteobacteria bacterium]